MGSMSLAPRKEERPIAISEEEEEAVVEEAAVAGMAAAAAGAATPRSSARGERAWQPSVSR